MAFTFLAELAGDGRALEFAIGTGRVAVPLRERGVPVVGIELSEHMVAVLRHKLDEDTLPVAIGDMATTVVPGEFTLVYLVYNTITNLLTQDEQVECFRNAARHLAPGGRFVIELGVPPLRFLPPGQVAVPFDVSEGTSASTPSTWSSRSSSRTTSPATATTAAIAATPPGTGTRGRMELDLMARIAGLEPERRVADWDGAPFTQDSAKHISVWRKPD